MRTQIESRTFLVSLSGISLFCILIGSSCSKDEVDDTDIVAQIGSHKISVGDFRIDYELSLAKPRPVRPAARRVDRKSEHLHSMVEGRLLAMAALDLNMDEAVDVQRLLKWHEKQAVIRQLYRQEIRDQVKVEKSESRNAFELLNEKVEVRQIIVPGKTAAKKLHQRIKQGESFERIAMDLAGSDEELKRMLSAREFTWGQLDENLETALFGLNMNEISAPIKTNSGYHLIQLINRKRKVLLTEYDYQGRQHYVETIIRRRREASLGKEYATSLMESLRPRAVGPVLLEFTELAKHALRAEGSEIQVPPYLQVYKVRPHLEEIRDRELVIFNGGSWTVGQFLDLVQEAHPGSRPDLTKPGPLQIYLSVLIRDEFLADLGYQRKLQKSEAVIEEVERVRDDLLASRLRRALWDTVQVSSKEIQDYFERNKDNYEIPEMVDVQEIMVRDKATADSLHDVVGRGADLAELAREHSVRKWAAKKGGALGYITGDAFGEIGRRAVKMSIGELSGSVPIKVDGVTVGYSVFKVIGQKPSQSPQLSEISSKVSRDALRSKRLAVLDRFLAGVKHQHPVQIDESVLQSIKTIAELTGPGRPVDILKVTRR